MKLFEFDKASFTVHLTEEALLLAPFAAMMKRDKTKNKDRALGEFAFMWFFTDITSPYLSIVDDKERQEEILKDLEHLPKGWKPDKVVQAAIEFYRSRDTTILKKLYRSSIKAAEVVNKTLENSEVLINESNDPILSITRITSALAKVTDVMNSLRNAEKELIREIDDKEGKKKGSKAFNTFEDMHL